MTTSAPIETIDWHNGGEPFRIVPHSPAALTGGGLTVAERRIVAARSDGAQWVRALLCGEPRGHADMYGGFPVPPDAAAAHLGACSGTRTGSRRRADTARSPSAPGPSPRPGWRPPPTGRPTW